MSESYSVVLAVRESEERLRLRQIIANAEGGRFQVEEFDGLPAMLERLREDRGCDILLLDLALAGSSVSGVFEQIRREAPETAIVALGPGDDEDLAIRTIHEGAQDYVARRHADAGQLIRSMRRAIERMHLDVELARERDLLRAILDHIPQGIYFKDLQSRFMRVSRQLAGAFNLPDASKALGKTDFDFLAEEHARQALADEQRIIRTGEELVDKEEKATRPNGDPLWVLTTKMPLRNHHGKIIGTFGLSRDITAQKTAETALAESNIKLQERQKQLEEALTELNKALEKLKATQQQLVEAEKMQTAGRLAYGVAHELRNPLNILNMGLEFLANDSALSGNEANTAILGEMRTGIRRADAVVSALMESSSEGDFKFEECDIRIPIYRTLTVFDAGAKSRGIRVVAAFAAGLPPVRIDSSKIEQVFDGVFRNAIDAMPSGGELTVRTLSRRLADTEIERDPGLRSGNRFRTGEEVVVVEIEDTGAGIPKDVLSKIYDPFFTTKETGSGAGMGLTICQKIIELHRGMLQVSNRETGGVRVTILFKMNPVL